MEIEHVNQGDRFQRGTSVLSGLSADDLEAAETLKSLGQGKRNKSETSRLCSANSSIDIHSPRLRQAPTTHVQSRTAYNHNEPEPVLALISSQYPLAASIINGSILVYKTARRYTPGGEWTETNVGLPLARTTARISGVESVARWALQPKQDTRNGQSSHPDIEKGYLELTPEGILRQSNGLSGEPLPVYNDGDRSPPYTEEVVLAKEPQSGAGLGHRLIITTSGLSIAMSEESIRSLKFCLSWLRWANSKLSDCTSSLQELLKQWERRSSQSSQPMSVTSLTTNEADDSALAAKIAALKMDVLSTLRQVVDVVSKYAGGALPENARCLVHQHLVSLPSRFNLASRRSSNEEINDAPTNNATQALLLAQQGLEIFSQVFRVLNDTLVSAEDWFEKLGGRRRQPVPQPPPALLEKPDARERSETTQADGDVKMEM